MMSNIWCQSVFNGEIQPILQVKKLKFREAEWRTWVSHVAATMTLKKRPSSFTGVSGILEDVLEEAISKLRLRWVDADFILHDREKGIPVRGGRVQSRMMVWEERKKWRTGELGVRSWETQAWWWGTRRVGIQGWW